MGKRTQNKMTNSEEFRTAISKSKWSDILKLSVLCGLFIAIPLMAVTIPTTAIQKTINSDYEISKNLKDLCIEKGGWPVIEGYTVKNCIFK